MHFGGIMVVSETTLTTLAISKIVERAVLRGFCNALNVTVGCHVEGYDQMTFYGSADLSPLSASPEEVQHAIADGLAERKAGSISVVAQWDK